MTNVSVSSIVAIRAESLTAAPYLGQLLKSRPVRVRSGTHRQQRGSGMRGKTLRRLSLLAVLATAAVAAFQVSTATAAAPSLQTSWLCSSAEYSSFSSLSQIGATGFATARGGVNREPALDTTLDTGPTARGYDPNFEATVPVWVHVISPDGTTGNVSQALIDDQIVVLNNTFSGGEGGVDTGFRFTL